MTSSENRRLSRRSTLKAAGWSAPVLAASTAVPAYAASAPNSSTEISANYGIFAQMINRNLENPYDTYAGVHSYDGAVSDSSGDAQYIGGEVVGDSGLAANGEGSFTPGGTIADNRYGGMGFWFSAPYDVATGEQVPGTTLLATGSSFEVTYRFTFNDEASLDSPLLWRTGADGPYLSIDNQSTSRLKQINGAPFRARMFEPVVEGLTWTGRVVIVLTADLLVSNEDVQRNLGQILASHHSVYYDMSEFLTEGEVTIAAADGAQLVLTAAGYDSKVISLAGQRATASLPFSSASN